MKEIDNLLEFLKNEIQKPIREFGKDGREGVVYFTPREYKFNEYNCELSELFSGKVSAIETFKKVYENEFFELHHPFYNDIKTRAVYNKYYFGVCNFCAIFLIDENNKYPWILYRFHSDYAIFTKDGIFVANKARINYNKSAEVWRGHWLEIVNLFKKWLPTIDKKDLVYKDAPYSLILSDARPYHLFNDQLNYLYLLDLKNSKAISTSKKSFFIPQGYKLTQDSTLTMPVIFSHSVGRESINLMRKNVLSESLQSFNTLVSEEDKNWGGGQNCLTLWLGIPGERRLWLNQYDGIPNLLKNLSLYFPKIRVFVDGMTAYDNERIKVINNLEAFNKIKNEVDKLKLDITLKSLSGYDYRTKLCYCSMCDLAISDVGTTSLTPFELGDKPGVAFCPNHTLFINHARTIVSTNIRKMVDVKYLQNAETSHPWLFDFFIPYEHLYNLTAEVIENLKNIKMHRLDVPSVSIVAEIYYLKEKQKELESLKMELKTTLANPKAANKILKNKNLELKNKKLELEIGALNKSLQIPIYIKEKDSAKARVTNYLGYKLGAAMILNSKSLMGIIRMPFVLSYIADKHNLEQKHYKRQIAKNPNLKRLPLESLSDHKEGLKFKQHLSYKLGEAFLKAKKTWYKGGLIKFCFVAKKLAKVHKNSIKTNRDI